MSMATPRPCARSPSTDAATADADAGAGAGACAGAGAPDSGADGDPEYGDPAFWHRVYSGAVQREHVAPEEWLLTYDHFHTQRWCRFLPRAGAVLDVGAGDSRFMEQAVASGCLKDASTRVTAADIVPEVVESNKARMAALPAAVTDRFTHSVLDARDMAGVPALSFGAVFDKSVFDALMCGDRRHDTLHAYLVEAWRVLSDGGVLLIVTLHEPEEVEAEVTRALAAAPGSAKFRSLVCESEWDSDELKYVYMVVVTKGLP